MMATVADVQAAAKLGQACRTKAKGYSADFKNPFEADSLEADAWRAGFLNDLDLWLSVRDMAEKKRRVLGRLRAHDAVVFNAHTSKPDRGEFLGYDRSKSGFCRVLLNRAGFTSVPRVSLTKPVKAMAEKVS